MERTQGITLDPDSIFDTQAKRLHEYKRQLMNALRMLMLYNRIVENPDVRHAPHDLSSSEPRPRPGYQRAKLIIKLINSIGDLVKKHPVRLQAHQRGLPGKLLRLRRRNT